MKGFSVDTHHTCPICAWPFSRWGLGEPHRHGVLWHTALTGVWKLVFLEERNKTKQTTTNNKKIKKSTKQENCLHIDILCNSIPTHCMMFRNVLFLHFENILKFCTYHSAPYGYVKLHLPAFSLAFSFHFIYWSCKDCGLSSGRGWWLLPIGWNTGIFPS